MICAATQPALQNVPGSASDWLPNHPVLRWGQRELPQRARAGGALHRQHATGEARLDATALVAQHRVADAGHRQRARDHSQRAQTRAYRRMQRGVGSRMGGRLIVMAAAPGEQLPLYPEPLHTFQVLIANWLND